MRARICALGPPFVFASERDSPFTVSGFRRMIERAAVGLEIKPRLRRQAGDGVGTGAYLGHRNIQHTVRYIELAPDRFKGFWRD
jgi:hypothetical protein